MATAEVSVVPRFSRRLARAVLLVAAGAAAHLWLSPVTSGPIDTPDREMARESSGAVGTAGRSIANAEATSTLGTLSSAPAAATNAVKVTVTTIRPAIYRAPAPATLRPANFIIATHTAPAADSVTFEPEPEVPQGHTAAVSEADDPIVETKAPEETLRAIEPAADLPPAVARAELTRTTPDAMTPSQVVSDETLVSAVLQQYRAAYERLDVSAAQSIWPTVDARALGAAFRQLAGQRVTFDSCGVRVSGSGAQATARCQGQAEFVPKVGARRPYVASGEWVFDLAKHDTAWRIVSAEATIK